jgi:nucleoside-diphosphate kinase
LSYIILVNFLEDVLHDMEQTLVLVKPDGVQRGLVGQVISRLERRGLKLVALKLMQVDDALARHHYGEHVERPFFRGLVDFITSGPLVAMVWEGENAVNLVRQTIGATDPVNSAPGTIRGDFGVSIGRNIVHGSDGPESAKREISLFFRPEEILDYSRSADPWIIEP